MNGLICLFILVWCYPSYISSFWQSNAYNICSTFTSDIGCSLSEANVSGCICLDDSSDFCFNLLLIHYCNDYHFENVGYDYK